MVVGEITEDQTYGSTIWSGMRPPSTNLGAYVSTIFMRKNVPCGAFTHAVFWITDMLSPNIFDGPGDLLTPRL